jgi:uncharacterized lipoprotein YddW (UPF0748 family)
MDRCIWVSRFEFNSAEDIEQIMDNCAGAGFTSVMFQVRGNGTVFFDSSRELWSEAHAYEHPGYDPLAVAVAAAHERGLALHAWVNLFPGWRGDPEKADPRQLIQARPDWFIVDEEGQPMALEANYYWLNPCLPEVRRYLASLCYEIAANYAVDGIHLDHCRFSDRVAGAPPVPGDERSRQLFNMAHGVMPEDNPQLFERWKTESVTQSIDEISASLAALQNRPTLSTAVWREPQGAVARHNQDWAAWTRAGLIDAVMPMNYDKDEMRFEDNLYAAVEATSSVPVIVGIGAYLHDDPEQTIKQMNASIEAGGEGVAIFSYASIFDAGSRDSVRTSIAFRRAISAWRR